MISLLSEELERYERQLKLIGIGGQKKLKNTKVLIVGAGGLGSAVSIYLTVAGIGKLVIVDGEVVELSNLNRQILYTISDIGKPKAECACKRLREINPCIEIECYNKQFDEDLGTKLIPQVDLVVDALDNWSTRFLLNRLCIKFKKPLVHAGIEGFYGQVMTIIPGKGPCLQCLFTKPPKERQAIPVIGITPGIIGILEASEVIKLALSIGEVLLGKMLIVDLLNNEFKIINVRRNPRCPVCGGII